MSPFVLSLSDPNVTLEAVGGKGMSPAKLARAGLPVPGGFHITITHRKFVAANGLQPHILKTPETVDAAIPATLETAAQAIGRLFAGAPVPLEVERAICAGYETLGTHPPLSSPKGTPVSPGVYEGAARIADTPSGAQLERGEILVTHSTDPSWTPLFLNAGAVIMETGGPISHGAIVAREYGIPAVVGVSEATTRLHTGQRLRVNGEAGEISCLD